MSYSSIVTIKYLRDDLIWDFSVPGNANYICAGLINANSAKTYSAMIEASRAVTGQDPYDKYPKRDGIAYFVALSENEISSVYYSKLFRSSRDVCMVRDPETKQWRAVRPWHKWDKANRELWRPTPPMIPHRFIATNAAGKPEIAWANKAKRVPRMIRLINGWELWFFSANSDSPRGTAIDLAVFDEELGVAGKAWYSETAFRLVDRRGRFIWSATPQAGTQALLDLYLRSIKDEEGKHVKFFHMHIDDNKYLSEEAKEEVKEKVRDDPMAWEVRVEGKFALLGAQVFNEFKVDGIHGVEPFPIPEDWTHYASIDPGHQVCAVLFFAVPPPNDKEHGSHIYVYDELYLRKCDAVIFAENMLKKTKGLQFEDFIIDHHGGRQTPLAGGKSAEVLYAEELDKRGILSSRRGASFSHGSDDPYDRVMITKKAMRIRPDGTPQLKAFRHVLPRLMTDIVKYHWQTNPEGYLTDKLAKTKYHAIDCLTMAIAYDLEYVAPSKRKRSDPPVILAYKMHTARVRAHEKAMGRTRSYINLGPGG